jgi:hypothetical protein
MLSLTLANLDKTVARLPWGQPVALKRTGCGSHPGGV